MLMFEERSVKERADLFENHHIGSLWGVNLSPFVVRSASEWRPGPCKSQVASFGNSPGQQGSGSHLPTGPGTHSVSYSTIFLFTGALRDGHKQVSGISNII